MSLPIVAEFMSIIARGGDALKRDLSLFEEGFNFYNNALELISSTGDLGEIDQHKSEFAQALQNIANLGETINEDAFKGYTVAGWVSL